MSRASILPPLAALALLGAAGSVNAAAPPVADRYGPVAAAPLPDAYAPPAAAAPTAYTPVEQGRRETARAAPLRTLTWPGKSSTPAPEAPPAAQATPVAQVRIKPLANPAAPPARHAFAPPAYAAAAPTLTPTFAPTEPAPVRSAPPLPYFAAPTPGTPPPASTSLAGPLAAAPVTAATPAGGQHARLYSVHRAYGMQPDAAPIPPQFFAQTADLSDPVTPAPLPNRAANAATRDAVNAARLAAAEAN